MKLLVGLLNIVRLIFNNVEQIPGFDYYEIDKYKCDKFTGLSNETTVKFMVKYPNEELKIINSNIY